MVSAHRQKLGRQGEAIAEQSLRDKGWTIIARNYRTARGEIDIIAYSPPEVVFVEVKTARLGSRLGPSRPAHAVDRRKQSKLREIAVQWLADRTFQARFSGIRFDVIGIVLDDSGNIIEYEHLIAPF